MAARQIIYPPDPWAPRPDQMPLWSAIQARVENILVITHRQFGKDELFLRGIGRDAMQTPGNYFYCLPKTVDVRKNMWEAVNVHTGMNRIDEAFPESIRKQKREDLMIIRMPTVEEGKHSNIFFTGSDNHTGLRGQTGVQYNFSEWAFSDPHSLGVVRPIVAANGGRTRFFTTAFGRNHAYKMLIDNANKPNWACFLISNNVRHPLADDPAARGIIHIQSHRLSEEKMKEILEENIQLYGPDIGKSLTAQEYECSFEEIVPGSFYLDLLLRAEREGRIMDLAPRPELPVHAAFDLGFTDPTAIWYLQVLEDGWVNVIGYDEYTLTSTPELVPELRRKPWYYGDILLPHDGAHHHGTSGTSPCKILTAAGFHVRVMPRTDDEAQIPSVRTFLPRCRFSRSPAVQRGMDCLRHFHNKAKTEGGRTSWSPKPVHDWCLSAGTPILTQAGWRPVETLSVHDRVLTPLGARRILRSGIVRRTNEWVTINGIRCTPEHRFFTSRGMVEAKHVNSSMGECWTREHWGLRILALLCAVFRFGFMAAITSATPEDSAGRKPACSYIGWSMRMCMVRFRQAMTFITKTGLGGITIQTISKQWSDFLIVRPTNQNLAFSAAASSAESSSDVIRFSERPVPRTASGTGTRATSETDEPAYNITVEREHCYFVKGDDGKAYLVSNSSHGAKAFATAAYYAPTFPHGLKPAPAPPKPSGTGANRYVESGWMA